MNLWINYSADLGTSSKESYWNLIIYIYLYIYINRGWPKWGKVSHYSLVRCEWAIPKMHTETVFKI